MFTLVEKRYNGNKVDKYVIRNNVTGKLFEATRDDVANALSKGTKIEGLSLSQSGRVITTDSTVKNTGSMKMNDVLRDMGIRLA